jgi:hypothetical protein
MENNKSIKMLYNGIIPNIQAFYNCNNNNPETEILMNMAVQNDIILFINQTPARWSPYSSHMMALIGQLDTPMAFVNQCPVFNPDCCNNIN